MKTIPDISHGTELNAFLRTAQKPLLVILGHTASGKTAFSIDLALALEAEGKKVEIINADSRQLYKGMDIGTAKITEEEKRGVVHHLFDVLDPKDPVTIAWYKKEAEKVIADCHARGVIPMMVGGSMLYISAVIDGLEPLDPVNPEKRKKLSDQYDQDEGVTLWNTLNEMDPEGAAGIERRNKVYLLRALEIVTSTGKSLAESKTKSESPYDLFLYGLSQEPEVRSQRINMRTKQLLESGWIDEVKHLMEKGYAENDPGMISHGYREIIAAMHSGTINTDLLAEEISSKTRQYAKRQMTWWKRDSRIFWVN
jgi:tRNA dimethylallyltransferase